MTKTITLEERIYKIAIIILALFFVISLICKFILCNSMAIDNTKLQNMFSERNSIEKEISFLAYVDSSLSSINEIERKALQIGFVPIESRLISLDIEAPVQVASLSR